MHLQGLILAAGLSSRMGSFKPLMHMQGCPMIERSVRCMLKAGVERVTLVLGFRGQEIEAALQQAGLSGQLEIVYNTEYRTTDMLHSIKLGVQAIGPCDAFYLLPGDMPAVHVSTFRRLSWAMQRGEGNIIFPTIAGWKKHPPLIAAQVIPRILEFSADGGLRELWKTMEPEIACIPVEDRGCSIDVDTRCQYEAACRYLG